MANQCYFSGNFWQCVTATAPGESPDTAADKWRKIKIPSKWRFAVAQLAYAHLLNVDGQTDKSNVALGIATNKERVGLADLVRQEANEEVHAYCHRGEDARVNTGRTLPVDASVILEDAYRLMDKDPTDVDFATRDKRDGRVALSNALQEVWEAWWWQELMVCARTPFAATLILPHPYQAGDAFYDPASDKYYSVLFTYGAGGTPPAQHPFLEKYDSAEMIAEPWNAASSYNAFDRVDYAGKEYQCYADGTPAGTLPTDVGAWWPSRGWRPVLPYTHYDGGKIGPFGPIRSVTKFDPRTSANPQRFEIDVTTDGTRVLGLTVAFPWVWSRRVTPVLTGDDFDPAATYEATAPEALVYES